MGAPARGISWIAQGITQGVGQLPAVALPDTSHWAGLINCGHNRLRPFDGHQLVYTKGDGKEKYYAFMCDLYFVILKVSGIPNVAHHPREITSQETAWSRACMMGSSWMLLYSLTCDVGYGRGSWMLISLTGEE